LGVASAHSQQLDVRQNKPHASGGAGFRTCSGCEDSWSRLDQDQALVNEKLHELKCIEANA
jgi:hypothetical protein